MVSNQERTDSCTPTFIHTTTTVHSSSGRKVLRALNKDLQLSAKASSSKSQSQRSNQGHSLLFLFDLEATGLSMYTDCITEIAGKVFDPPVDVKQATFSSLVHTDHHIPKIGTTPSTLLLMLIHKQRVYCICC